MVDEGLKEGLSDLESIYQARFDRLVGLADWLVGDRRLAEELVQETFVRLVETEPALLDPGALEAYVRSAVVNQCKSKIRRLMIERRHARQIRDEGVYDSRSDPELRKAIASLPTRQRQCTVLRFYEDLSVRAIAATLKISDGSVKTHLHRALGTGPHRRDQHVPRRIRSPKQAAPPGYRLAAQLGRAGIGPSRLSGNPTARFREWMVNAAQTAAIPCFPLLFWLLAERTGERPRRTIEAAVLWSSTGITTVLGAVALTDQILARTNSRSLWRLWPNKGQEMPGLDLPLGPEWTVSAIAQRELIAVVLIAILTAVSLRIAGRYKPPAATLWLPNPKTQKPPRQSLS